MEFYGRVGLEKISYLGRFVSREIVCDDMNLLLGWAKTDYFAEKSYELIAGVSRSGLAMHLARLNVQCRIQRERSMAEVFKSVAFGPAPVTWAGRDRAGPMLG